MYQLFVEEHFDAAHYIRNYRGKCENLHGHRFKVIARLEATGLNEAGLAYDFAELKRHLRELLARFDHACLNDVSPFDQSEPTCENIAANVYDSLRSRLLSQPVRLASVEVWETPTSGAAYSP
jgi:6-pyruvoyltetrahydropterin/6-carboxytetrahydropterin synthase